MYSVSPSTKLSNNFRFANLIGGGSRTAATSKMELFVIIVNRFQPLTIFKNYSILDDKAVLDLTLVINNTTILTVIIAM